MAVRLTQTVQKGGCAAKISAEVLRQVLSEVDFRSTDPDVLIDGRNFDDAGIYRVGSDLALVQTLDFFTPIVDTPRLFGQIAAANSLSDVYAMGGTPKTAMAILAFPLATLDPEIMKEVLEGARAKILEAGCSMIGGHSIDDETLKFGLSVTGLVHPSKVLSNRGARPGDRLILTKAIGTGTLCAGLKNGDYDEAMIRDALDSMALLNGFLDLLDPSDRESIHAATDITGFGLLGHALQVARASGVALEITAGALPLFSLTLDSLRAENLTKAHRSNRSYTASETFLSPTLSAELALALVDPQTSGGLLLSVEAGRAETILQKLKTRFPAASLIGGVVSSRTPGLAVHD